MSGKQIEETKTVIPRCLAIILKEKRWKKADTKPENNDNVEGKTNQNNATSVTDAHRGRDLFDEFVIENKQCYWNPHLEESLKSARYLGYVQPNTLLVGGRDIYLETIRSAWSRRVLRAPANYSLVKIGEVGSVEMQVVSQTQFTPLPEALCLIISQLTKAHQAATLDSIMVRLKETYRGLQQPSEQIIYETLGILIKEGKIGHRGIGYYIITPDMYKLNGCVTVHDNHLVIGGSPTGTLPTIYIPLPATQKTEMHSVSCQTESKSDKSKTERPKMEGDEKKAFERSHSMREQKKGKDKKPETFSRSSSMRYSDEKGKSLVKDINLKTSDIHQDKNKGEKISLLNKLFGRNKKKTLAADDKTPSGVEYATFSGQFPPPEWQWYESQLSKNMTQSILPKSQTCHQLHAPYRLDVGVQSDFCDDEDDHDYACPVHRSRTVPAEMRQCSDWPHRRRSDSWHSQGSRSSSQPTCPEFEGVSHSRRHEQLTSSKRMPHSKRDHSKSRVAQDNHREQTRVLCDGGEAPVKPKMKIHKNSFDSDGYCDTLDETCTPDCERATNSVFPTVHENNVLNNVPCSNEQHSAHNNSYKNKVFRKYKDMHCTTFCNTDISFEYCGKLPQKNAIYSMSRDSGVNCIGLGAEKRPLPNEIQIDNRQGVNSNTPIQSNNVTSSNSLKPVLNNEGSQVVHQAQVHFIAEAQDDSGFNSPRTGDQINNSTFTYSPTDPMPPKIDKLGHHGNATRASHRHSKTSPIADPVIAMTNSDHYPSCEYIAKDKTTEQHNMMIRSMWSDSSKQTVCEIGGGGKKKVCEIGGGGKQTVCETRGGGHATHTNPPQKQYRRSISPCKQDSKRDSSPVRQTRINKEPHVDSQPLPEYHRDKLRKKDKHREKSPKRYSTGEPFKDYAPVKVSERSKEKRPTSCHIVEKQSKSHSKRHLSSGTRKALRDNLQPLTLQYNAYRDSDRTKLKADYEVVGVV